MKQNHLIAITAMILTLSAVFGCSKGYQTEKTTGDVKIAVTAARYPLVKGDNSVAITVKDSSGRTITDAKVEARYYMPPMPGMAPMEYTAQPALTGGAYSFDANIPMEGGWKIDVAVTQPGKPTASATFNLDAR